MKESLPKDEYRAARRAARQKEKPPEPVMSKIEHDRTGVPRPFRRAVQLATRGAPTRRTRKPLPGLVG